MRELQVRTVTVHGDIAPGVYAYARHKIGQVAKLAPGPVLLANVKFDQAPDPAVARPALVQVSGLVDACVPDVERRQARRRAAQIAAGTRSARPSNASRRK